MFNPHSAFPKQTTFTPYAGGNNIQRAVNAPNLGANIGAASGPVMNPQAAAQYERVARAAMLNAQGAHSTAVGMQNIYNRPSALDELYAKTSPKHGRHGQALETAAGAAFGERLGEASHPGATPGGGIGAAAPQPAEMGIPARVAQRQVRQMATQILGKPSPSAPLAAVARGVINAPSAPPIFNRDTTPFVSPPSPFPARNVRTPLQKYNG